MKIGMVLPMNESDGNGAGTWARIRQLARHAEAAGLDSLWVYDHFIFRMPDEPEDGIHEAWTLLTAVAAVTERVDLGTIVLGTGFRPPALMAKMAATLDEVSSGRLILGIGTGWHESEYTAFGYPFDHRAGRFEEALAIIAPLVHGERVTLHGRWHDVDDAVLIPPPPRPARLPGRIPILIAAKGERMLRLTARHA
ncbi:MAG TPA: LLM class flavin-dependent oxidoreductase, partial [Candidatus Limnocylindrales bacterium]